METLSSFSSATTPVSGGSGGSFVFTPPSIAPTALASLAASAAGEDESVGLDASAAAVGDEWSAPQRTERRAAATAHASTIGVRVRRSEVFEFRVRRIVQRVSNQRAHRRRGANAGQDAS